MATKKTTKPKSKSKVTVKSDYNKSDILNVKASNISRSSLLGRKYMIFLAVLVLAGALYLSRGLFVAATVNGFPISRFEIIRELEKQSGKQTLESTITKELINQEAKKNNISITNEEVQGQIDEIKKSLEAQGTTLDAALTMQGQTQLQLEDNIRLQKVAEKLLADKTSVNEDEMKKYYDENKDSFSGGSYESVKGQIESQLKAQKFQTEIEAYLTDLKSKYKINYFVKY